MTFSGHADYDSLKPYIAITDKTRKNLMTTMFSKKIDAAEIDRRREADVVSLLSFSDNHQFRAWRNASINCDLSNCCD